MHELDSIVVAAIDDDPDDLAILRHNLDRMPEVRADLRTFTDPEAGIEECHAQKPGVVLLDFHMGSRTGLEVFGDVQRQSIEVPVTLVTDQGNDQGNEATAVEALHPGGSDSMPKDVVSPVALRRSLRGRGERLELTVQRLEARNAMMESFHHSLSHELKTPLTAVYEFVSIVLDGVQGPLTEAQRDSLSTAKAACAQVTAHVNDILDTSRIETGKLALERSHQPLEPLLRQAIAQAAHRAQHRGITLDGAIEPGCEARIDGHRILQVLTNLIDNALKFTHPGGSVRVRIAHRPEDPDQVTIVVQDDGCGIPPDACDLIFERLYQARDEDDAALGGMGLGLHLCRELMRSHGGGIEVHSEVGRGSTFTCWLPVGQRETELKEAS